MPRQKNVTLSWIEVRPGTTACSIGPWALEVSQLPSLLGDKPSYSFKVSVIEEKLKEVHDLNVAQTIALRFLAIAAKGAIETLIEIGAITVKKGALVR